MSQLKAIKYWHCTKLNSLLSSVAHAPSFVHVVRATILNVSDRVYMLGCLLLSYRLYVKIFYQTIKSIHIFDTLILVCFVVGAQLNTEILCIFEFLCVFTMMMMASACWISTFAERGRISKYLWIHTCINIRTNHSVAVDLINQHFVSPEQISAQLTINVQQMNLSNR